MFGLSVIWNQILENIENYIKSSNEEDLSFISYLKDCSLLELNEDSATLSAPYITKFVIEENPQYLDYVNYGFKKLCKKEIDWQIKTINDDLVSSIQTTIEKDLNDNINEEYTFDNFVVGPSNLEARTAAYNCAKNPGNKLHNPLVIYGDSGLGKTHLLSAIGNQIKILHPEKKILYISCSDLVNEVYYSIKEKRIDEYKNQLYSLDVLLVDDIQNLSGKEKTCDVFFDVYNKLYNNHKQIILTSDCPPEAIKDIETRLKTRFYQGLSVTIQALENETAYKILLQKIKNHNIEEDSIKPEVLNYIANNYSSNVRELEGTLNTLLFYSINFSGKYFIDLDLALEALTDKKRVKNSKDSPLSINDVIKAVANYYGLTEKQLIGNTRTKNIANARHIAMYLCRHKIQDASYLKIGEEFGGRDHSTVLSACEKIDKLISTDSIYSKVISEIESTIK